MCKSSILSKIEVGVYVAALSKAYAVDYLPTYVVRTSHTDPASNEESSLNVSIWDCEPGLQTYKALRL